MRFVFCPYLTFLTGFFSLVFLPTVFILNEDQILIAAYELGDAGNLIYSVMSLFDHPIYNLHNYFFAGYGWPFSDISFLLILILKVIGQLLGFYESPIFGLIDDQPLFNGTIRAINFVFSLASLLLFFKLSQLLFDSKKVSLVASLFLMFLPWSAVYSYWLKTDASAMFFTLLAIWYLVKFIKQAQKPLYFYLAFVSLILATFSKMYHGFLLFPIFLIFFLSYCDKQKMGYFKCLFSSPLLKLFISLPPLYLLVAFIVHPYSMIDFGDGVWGERWMFMPWEVFFSFLSPSSIAGQGGGGHLSVPFIESFQNWIALYRKEPLIYLNVILLYLLIIPLLVRHKFSLSLLLITSVIFCNVYLVIVMLGNRTMHYELRYIYPIAPLLILNLVAFGLYIWNLLGYLPIKNRRWLKIFVASLGILFILPVFAKNLLVTTNSLLARAAYQQSTLYQTRKFLLNNVSTLSQKRMLFDLGTAPVPPKATWVKPHAEMSWVPSKIIDSKSFKDYINSNAPIIWVSWESSANGPKFIENIQLQFLIVNEWRAQNYRDYIRKNRFKLIKKFQATRAELVSLSNWFPHYKNTQLESFNTTLKLIEVYRNPHLMIGPTIVFYGNKL